MVLWEGVCESDIEWFERRSFMTMMMMIFNRAVCLPKSITSLKISSKINYLQNYVKTTKTIYFTIHFIKRSRNYTRVLKELGVGCV